MLVEGEGDKNRVGPTLIDLWCILVRGTSTGTCYTTLNNTCYEEGRFNRVGIPVMVPLDAFTRVICIVMHAGFVRAGTERRHAYTFGDLKLRIMIL